MAYLPLVNTAPCFEGMVQYSMGLVLMHRDNEDGKDNVKSAYRTV